MSNDVFKVGGKCKLPDGAIKRLGLEDLMPCRWTINSVDNDRYHIQLDHAELEVKMGPMPAALLEVWSDEDERVWIEDLKSEVASNMPADIANICIDLEQAIKGTELLGLDATKLREALALVEQFNETLGLPDEVIKALKDKDLI